MAFPIRTALVVVVIVVAAVLVLSLTNLTGGIQTSLGPFQVQVWGEDAEGNRVDVALPPALVKVGGNVIVKLFARVQFTGTTNDPAITQYRIFKTAEDVYTGKNTGIGVCVAASGNPTQCLGTRHKLSDAGTFNVAIGVSYNLKTGTTDATPAFEWSATEMQGGLAPGNYLWQMRAKVAYSKTLTDTAPSQTAFVTLSILMTVEEGTVTVNLTPINCSTDVGGC